MPQTKPVDKTKILMRREIAIVLGELHRKAPRSKNTRLNLVIFRLACCCGLRASEIAQLHIGDVRTETPRPHEDAAAGTPFGQSCRRLRRFGPMCASRASRASLPSRTSTAASSS